MDLNVVLPIAIPAIAALIAFLVKVGVMNRIEKLEHHSMMHVTEDQVRQTLADKLEPMKEDLVEIKAQLNRLFDKLINS